MRIILSFNFCFCLYAASLKSITPLVLYFFSRTSAASFGIWKVHFLIIFFNIFMHFPSNFEGTHVPPFSFLLPPFLFPVSRFSLFSLSLFLCRHSSRFFICITRKLFFWHSGVSTRPHCKISCDLTWFPFRTNSLSSRSHLSSASSSQVWH